MEKMILSLKNIYKLLMTNDFPIYSESVIGEKNRKGQTLLRFWQSLLIDEFRSLPYGKMIWRNDGKRNRYFSNLCNRSTDLRSYREYAKELSTQISTPVLLKQINRFIEFLSGREYKHDVLIRRIREMMRLCEAEDNCMPSEIAAQINRNLSNQEWLQRHGAEGNLFQAGYLLTLLMLYAAAGEAMDDFSLTVLRNDTFSLTALWKAHDCRENAQKESVTFLTENVGMIQNNALPRRHFFGREEELYDLMEVVSENRKCLISGIGGIGKTELLRQVIRLCVEEQTIDKIAIVSYDAGIVESFVHAFPGYERQDKEDSFRRIIHKLNQEVERGNKLLLLIDNLNNGIEDDPELAQLASLSCGVLITSRRSKLEGFEAYRVTAPPVSTGILIFRDNYGSPLTSEDREQLMGLLRDQVLCHPLTLRLMARAAHSKSWSVSQMREYFQQKKIALTWTEEDRTIRLNRIYSQLYSMFRIPEICRDVVELFSVLPVDTYSAAFLMEYFPEICAGNADLQMKLNALVEGGWLDEDRSGFFMHPFISQCLRRKVINETHLIPILCTLRQKIPHFEIFDPKRYQDMELRCTCEIIVYASKFISGNISRDLMLDILTAMRLIVPTKQVKERYQQFLRQLIRRCPDRDDMLEVTYYTTLGHWLCDEQEMYRAVYRKQKERLSVPQSLYFDFCAYVGGCLMYQSHFELAEEMLQEVMCEEAAPVQKTAAYTHLAAVYKLSGNYEAALQAARQGAEYANTHPECGDETRFSMLHELCIIHLIFGRQQAAEPILREMKLLLNARSLPGEFVSYRSLAALYALNSGDLEQALEHHREIGRLLLEHYGQDRNYFSNLSQMAIVLQRQKRYNEAVQNYKAALEHVRKVDDAHLIHVISNNLGSVYLDMEEPECALTYLETALHEARRKGGIALAEVRRNMARAYGQLNDLEREYACLKEASPLLDEAYGPQHPRSEAARQRLSELESNSQG